MRILWRGCKNIIKYNIGFLRYNIKTAIGMWKGDTVHVSLPCRSSPLKKDRNKGFMIWRRLTGRKMFRRSRAKSWKSKENYIIFPWPNTRINHDLRYSQSRAVGNEGQHVYYVTYLICIYFLINGVSRKKIISFLFHYYLPHSWIPFRDNFSTL